MKVAITGATGSLGGALIELLRQRGVASRVVALSRDEVKSGDLAERYADWVPLRCQLGDVRDERRLEEVFRGCDVVVHAAALKRIGHSVYSPEEVVKTNVFGTINVVRAATAVGVRRVLVISSDKAVEPLNLYGATKFVAETYATQACSYAVPRGTLVAVARYGNVFGSRGSVVHAWWDQLRRTGRLKITDERMTRFVITLPQAAQFVLQCVVQMAGGEVFVPRLPAARLTTLADAVAAHHYRIRAPHRAWDVVGFRPGGEKLHESLISREEPFRTWLVERGPDDGFDTMVVLPSHHSWTEHFAPPSDVRLTMPYSSDEPVWWLSREDLEPMVAEVLG